MAGNPARDEERDLMGGPEPDGPQADVMEGPDPEPDEDVMDDPRPGQDRPAR
jgi:hypothetical protein